MSLDILITLTKDLSHCLPNLVWNMFFYDHKFILKNFNMIIR